MDREQWQSAMLACRRRAIQYAESRLGPYRRDAEDVVQDAFLWVWEHQSRYDPTEKASPETWIINKVLQRARDWKRAKRWRGVQEGKLPREQCVLSVEDQLLKTEELRRMLEALPKRYWGVVERVYLHGERHKDACRAEGVGYATWMRWKQLLRGDINHL